MDQISYFEYPSFARVRVIPKIGGALCLSTSILLVLVGWPFLFADYLSGGLPTDWFYYVVMPIPLFFFGGMALNMFPDLGISAEGLHVRFFAVKWLFVPWSDVIDLSITPATAASKTPGYVIRVRKLTIWHRMLGYFMGSGTTPGVIFASDIEGYDRLVRELRTHIEKAQGEVQAE